MSAITMAIALAIASANDSGVHLDACESDGAIWISSIERTGGAPGSGANVLRLLMELAQEHGIPIRGAIVRDHDALGAYYSDLGFDIAYQDERRGSRRVIIEFQP